MSSHLQTIQQRAGGEAAVPASTAAAFRTAMRTIAASVTIISARDAQDRPHGMAASAVISVSMDPPSMLIAVNRSASIQPVIEETGLFCVNILDGQQAEIVSLFARSEMREHRFSSSDWARGHERLPHLASAQSAVFCAVDASLRYGTHSLYVGRVLEIAPGSGAAPLLWFDGGHAELRRLTA